MKNSEEGRTASEGEEEEHRGRMWMRKDRPPMREMRKGREER